MSVKFTHDFISEEFEKLGWKLISKYEGINKYLTFICNKGCHHTITYKNFKRNPKCSCYPKNIRKLKIEDVEKLFKNRNWKLLGAYVNSKTPVEFECDKGHKHKISLTNFRNGDGCYYCSKRIKPSNTQVIEKFKEKGWTLLSEYKNTQSVLEFECDKGHRAKISLSNLKKGRGCGKCHNNLDLKQAKVVSEFKAKGWKLLSNYKNNYSPLNFQCNKKHLHTIAYSDFKKGNGCGKCFEESLEGCNNITAFKIYKRIQKHSKLSKEILMSICSEIITTEVVDLYKKTPGGCNVDHIIPFSWFDHDDIKQIKACWNIDNLRYLPATKNVRRGNTLSKVEFNNLTEKQLNILKLASFKSISAILNLRKIESI